MYGAVPARNCGLKAMMLFGQESGPKIRGMTKSLNAPTVGRDGKVVLVPFDQIGVSDSAQVS